MGQFNTLGDESLTIVCPFLGKCDNGPVAMPAHCSRPMDGSISFSSPLSLQTRGFRRPTRSRFVAGVLRESSLVIPALSRGCPELDFPSCGSRPPRPQSCLGSACTEACPPLPKGSSSPTTAAARDPFRNSPLEFIHPASQSGQPAVWAEPVSEVTVDVTNVTMNPRLLRLVSQDIAGAGKDAAKKAVHPPTNQLCLPIRNECLIYRSPPWQKSKHHSNPSFSPPCSQGVP